MKLRQVALVAAELEPIRTDLLGLFGINEDYSDPGVGEFGLTNSVMALGDTFLEIVAPNQPNTAAGRLLAQRTGTCGYMVLMQVHSYADVARSIDAQQMRKVWEVQRPEVSACHVHPKDIGAAIVSFDEMRPPASWLWAGPRWAENRAKDINRILGCAVQSPDPKALANRWGEMMHTAPQAHHDGFRLSFYDGTFLDFLGGDAFEGISGITFESDNPDVIFARAAELGLRVGNQNNEITIGEMNLCFTKAVNRVFLET